MSNFEAHDAVYISYINHRKDLKVRHIIPKELYYGATTWHPEPQWLLKAYDLDKKADRTFAMLGILVWDITPIEAPIVMNP